MATLNATVLSLLDHAKRLDPDGKIAKIVEMLNQTNELIEALPFLEGNLPTGHQYTMRTGLPTVFWRMINQGVPTAKSTTAQATEQCGMLHARAQVDQDLAALNGNTPEFRLSEAKPQMEAMNQEVAQTLIYGNQGIAVEEFTGLAPRYSAISGAINASHVLSGAGAGSDNSSVWLLGLGEGLVHGMFPKGSQAGLKHEDLGLQDAFDSNNNRFRAWMDHWQWKIGLCVPDWRYAVRICNIDISNLVAKSSAADLTELMIKAMHRIPNPKLAKLCFIMNRTVLQMLDIQRRDDVGTGGGLTFENVDGVPRNFFRGVPIYVTDALLETEATVV